jgi:hypothetical protein
MGKKDKADTTRRYFCSPSSFQLFHCLVCRWQDDICYQHSKRMNGSPYVGQGGRRNKGIKILPTILAVDAKFHWREFEVYSIHQN